MSLFVRALCLAAISAVSACSSGSGLSGETESHVTGTSGTSGAPGASGARASTDASVLDGSQSSTGASRADASLIDASDPEASTRDPLDAQGIDANVSDAQVSDAQVNDAQVSDAQVSDANVSDANVSDAHVIDADAGTDAGHDAGGGTGGSGEPPSFDECTPWTASVDPGTYVCSQEPPPDLGPFGYRVAMTFDDGPNLSTTPAIVAILREANIPATFFMSGWNLESAQQQALAREIHEDPLFRIANHTYSHRRLPNLPLDEVPAQLDDTTRLLQRAAGDPCFYPRYFRFPFSASSCETVELVRERGLSVVGVHIETLDWCYAADGTCMFVGVPPGLESDMIGLVLTRLERYQGGIMLMHDIHPHTVAQLPALIDALRDAGVTFVRLDDASVFPLINAAVTPPEPPACCVTATP